MGRWTWIYIAFSDQNRWIRRFAGCLLISRRRVWRRSDVVESKSDERATFQMVGSVASKWGALDDVVTALLHVLNKHDHLSAAIADLCGDAADRYDGSTVSGRRFWREV